MMRPRWAVGSAASASVVVSYFVLTRVTAVTNITVRAPLAERPARPPDDLLQLRDLAPERAGLVTASIAALMWEARHFLAWQLDRGGVETSKT
jgi:hypothetical protein